MGRMKRVTLIGLGAMGVFFAPKLDACLGKGNFRVLAGGARKERLESAGVMVNGTNHHFTVVDPEQEGDPADLILMAVKDMSLDQAILDIRNQVGPGTQILCVMNGIDSEERVAAVYGWERVLYSYMRISIVMQDGVANFNPEAGKVHFGEEKNFELTERVLRIKELFDSSGIKNSIDEDMKRGMWFKFMCNIGENMTCAMFGVPFGAFQVSRHANEIRYQAMREVIQIANRLGIDLSQDDIDRQEHTIMNLPFINKPSTLQDLENGRKTEIEMFAGKVVRLGKELGIDTPVNWMYYQGIKLLEEKNSSMFHKKEI